jgi:hypothetical protein
MKRNSVVQSLDTRIMTWVVNRLYDMTHGKILSITEIRHQRRLMGLPIAMGVFYLDPSGYTSVERILFTV